MTGGRLDGQGPRKGDLTIRSRDDIDIINHGGRFGGGRKGAGGGGDGDCNELGGAGEAGIILAAQIGHRIRIQQSAKAAVGWVDVIDRNRRARPGSDPEIDLLHRADM